MQQLIENEPSGLHTIISECKGQPFPICFERYFLLKETSNNLKDILTLILLSFPRDIDTLECLYSELFAVDPSKSLISLCMKNPKGLIFQQGGEDQDLVNLIIIFLQKTLKLTEKNDRAFILLKLLRLIGSLLFFFPIENKIMDCRILVQKVLEQYKNIKKDGLDIEYIELLALISFGMNAYEELLVDDKDGVVEEDSYLKKLINQFKEENQDFDMIMEGLTLKVINNAEEKLVELYEIICRILGIKDPENLGQEMVTEKFSKKSFVHKMNKILGPVMIASIKDRLAVQNPKEYMSFWRDNLLLEVLRMNKETINGITGPSAHQVYFDFMLNVRQPYRDYEYKILQRILTLDFGNVKKEDTLILKKMHQIILSEEFFKHIHMNLFMIYYSLRMTDLNKKNNHEKDYHNVYFSKILKVPIPAYLRMFEKVNKQEKFSGREARTQKKFYEELTFLLLKYFEFFFLPFSKLKLDSFKFQDKQIEILISDSCNKYEKNFEEALEHDLTALQSRGKNNFALEKRWHMLFQCDPVKTSQSTFIHFLKKSKKPEAYHSLINSSFLDPLAFILLNKELFRDIEILKILLQSLSTQLSVWEMFSKETTKGNLKKYMSLLKNTIVHYMIEIMGLLKKPAASTTVLYKDNIAIMCEYIHIFCVEDKELIEALIREGFDFDMVESLVDGVEWMHYCLVIADDLLQTRNYEKKVFYILLLSYIIKKYPMMSYYALAKRLLEYDLKMRIDCSQMQLVKYVKQSLEVLTKTFPDLQKNMKEVQQFYATYTLCS